MWREVVSGKKKFGVLEGDCIARLKELPDKCIQSVVTSPPYWGLRDYGVEGQLGLEATPGEYVAKMVALFGEVRRVLRDDGVLWLNLGDSYASDTKTGGRNDTAKMYGEGSQQLKAKRVVRDAHDLKTKDLVGIPWRVAFALQADGWYLRADVIWDKPNPMPEPVNDRPSRGHEYIFLLAKSAKYFYDIDATRRPHKSGTNSTNWWGDGEFEEAGVEGRQQARRGTEGTVLSASSRRAVPHVSVGHPLGKNLRTVWTIPTKACHAAHFAVFPWEIPRRCIAASTRPDDIVFDPFTGSGTTGAAALANGRRFIGTELNPEYVKIANDRILSAMKALAPT